VTVNKSLKSLLVLIAIGAAGYGVGRYLQPAKIVEVEKVVEKERKSVETVVKEIIRPDGTKETQTTKKEVTNKERDTDKSKTIEASKPQYFIVAGYGLTQNAYTLNANRRILGNIYAGVYGTYSELSKVNAGLTVGYEF